MIVLYIIYVFVMFMWINSLKNRLYKLYEKGKKEYNIVVLLIGCALAAFLDIIEFVIIIRFLYATKIHFFN